MIFWFWVGLSVIALPPFAYGLAMAALFLYVRWKYLDYIVRIFQEKPLFIIPRGSPIDGADDVILQTPDGLALKGSYIPHTSSGPRKGVILFGLEFGSNRWSCRHYCERLLAEGFDIFAVELRNQGESDKDPNYEPLQWVTDKDVADMKVAVSYLLSRPDADPRGIGFFGISKGASTGMLAALNEPRVRCAVTDGAYATYTTVVPYLRKWIRIYSDKHRLQNALPRWFFGQVGMLGVRKVARNRGVTYPSIEKAIRRFGRPLLMIHGEADSYILPGMAQALYEVAEDPKELWIVPQAKHNQALQVATEEYHRRILAFFDKYLNEAAPMTERLPSTTSKIDS